MFPKISLFSESQWGCLIRHDVFYLRKLKERDRRFIRETRIIELESVLE